MVLFGYYVPKKLIKFRVCIQGYGEAATRACTVWILNSKGLMSHLMPIFIKGSKLCYFCLPSLLGTNSHVVPNGQPQQLGMMEHILHVEVVGSILNFRKAVDAFHLFNLTRLSLSLNDTSWVTFVCLFASAFKIPMSNMCSISQVIVSFGIGLHGNTPTVTLPFKS